MPLLDAPPTLAVPGRSWPMSEKISEMA